MVRAEQLLLHAGGEVLEAYGYWARSGNGLVLTQTFEGWATRPYARNARGWMESAGEVVTYYDGEHYLPTARSYTQRVRVNDTAAPTLNGSGANLGTLTAATRAVPGAGVRLGIEGPGITPVIVFDTGASGSQTRTRRLGNTSVLNGLSAGSVYTFRAGFYLPDGQYLDPADVFIRLYDNVNGYSDSAPLSAVGQWEELSVTHTIDGSATEAYAVISIGDSVALTDANEEVFMVAPSLTGGGLGYLFRNTSDADQTGAGAGSVHIPISPPTDALTLYARFRPYSLVDGGTSMVLRLGSGTDYIDIRTSDVDYGVGIRARIAASGLVTEQSEDVSIAAGEMGDEFEVLIRYGGVPEWTYQVVREGVTRTQKTYSPGATINTLRIAHWSDERLVLGANDVFGDRSSCLFRSVKVAVGLHNIADMRLAGI